MTTNTTSPDQDMPQDGDDRRAPGPQGPHSGQDPDGSGPDRPRDPDAPAPLEPPDPDAGIDREVGDLEDPDAEDEGALPGRVGGGLAGG